MKGKKRNYIIFFILLIGAFFAFLALANNGEILKKRHKTIATVQPFNFTNQDGGVVTERDIEDKVSLVAFFFTTCRTICPKMNNTIKSIYEEFKNEKDFLVLSHTCDPAHDNPALLRRYADSIGANTRNWWFLTGRKDSLYLAARHSYAVDDQQVPLTGSDDDFIHTQLFALVNREGRVMKKVYDSFNAEEMEELRADIRKALKE
jgi:protein SCO1